MSSLVRKSLDTPDETRPFEADAGQLQLVNTDEGAVGRATFQAGMAVVGAREAHREDRQLPGQPCRLLRLRTHEGRHG